MSIINQTLRELDARKTDSVPPRVAPRPAAAVRRRPGLWAAAGVLVPIAGLLTWFVFRAAERVLPAHADSTQRVVPQTAQSTAKIASVPLALPPVAAPVQTPQRVRPERIAVASPVKPLDADAQAPHDAAQQTTPLPATRPPAIHKEVSQPTAEEEADERYRKAVTLMRKGRDNQARPLLEEAIRLLPGHAAARQMLATLLSEAGQNREAEAVLREGCAVSPDNAWFALGLARLQAARGDAAAAVASLQGGAGGHGVDAEYHATFAALLVRLKRHAEAAQQYQQALKLQPGQGTWWLGLALTLEAQGKTSEAHSAYGHALAAGNLPEKLVEFVRAKVTE